MGSGAGVRPRRGGLLRKRPLWRTLVKISLVGIASVVVLAAILVGLLHTSWGKSVVRRRIEAQLAHAVNGTVTIGAVDYGFLFSSVTVRDVVIRDHEGVQVVAVGSLHVVPDRMSLVHGAPVIDELAIDGLAVTVIEAGPRRTNLTALFVPSGSPPPASIRVTHVRVAGGATITRRDGTTIDVANLVLDGSATARPRQQIVDAKLGVTATVTLAVPGLAPKRLDLAIPVITVARHGGELAATLDQLAFGALTIGEVHAQLALVDGKLAGAQAITIAQGRLDHSKLTTLLGKQLILDDIALDASLSGPADKLVVHGAVSSRHTTLTLDGTADASQPALPRYDLVLVGKGASEDLISGAPLGVPTIETDIRLAVAGSGLVPPDLDAAITLDVAPTRVGVIAIEGLSAHAVTRRGGVTVDRFVAHGLGFEIGATGDIASDTMLHGRITVAGNPVEAIRVLREAGIAVGVRVPPIPRLEIVVTANGKLDGALAFEVEPMHVQIAGGTIALGGHAALEHRQVRDAMTRIELHHLDLGALARLARREASPKGDQPPPTLQGSVSGTLGLTRTGAAQRVAYDLTIAVREPALAVEIHGAADLATADVRARIVRAGDHAELATVVAKIAVDDRGLLPNGHWHVVVDAPQRALAELVALAPPELRAKLVVPDGDAQVHVELGGTPNQPTGTIDAIVHAASPIGAREPGCAGRSSAAEWRCGVATGELHATLAGTAHGITVTTHGTVGVPVADDDPTVVMRDPFAARDRPKSEARTAGAPRVRSPFVTVDGTLTLPTPFVGRTLSLARIRAGLAITETIEVPERDLASVPLVPAAFARFGGKVDAEVQLGGSIAALTIAARAAWRGYPVASGMGDAELVVNGSLEHALATLTAGPISATADVTRAGDRIAIAAKLHAAPTPLVAVLPAPLVIELVGIDPGTLRSDLGAQVELAKVPNGLALTELDVTGSLSLRGGALPVPHTTRRWHDLEIELAGDPHGVRLTRLAAHESDEQVADRSLSASGLVTIAKQHVADGSLALHLERGDLELVLHDWLALGTGSPLASDAPVASVDLDAVVTADLAAPVIGIDATIAKLDFRAPDRLERSHQPERAQVSADVIYLDESKAPAGTLPVPAPTETSAGSPHRVPIDVRIHLPRPIHALKSPLDVMAQGELTVQVRDTGVATRGSLDVVGGKLMLFGREHPIISGSLAFTDAHPHGDFALSFRYDLPPEVVRELAHSGVRLSLSGPPTKPLLTMAGATNSTLAEVLTTYHAGHPVYVGWPGLYPSAVAEDPDGETFMIFGFLANALPHLLFLDRAFAWSDPNEPRANYGRVRNLEAETYAHDRDGRLRVVGRPTTPGRSTAELQLDHLWVDTTTLLVGAGVRAGDRLGGGVGLFFEWSSEH